MGRARDWGLLRLGCISCDDGLHGGPQLKNESIWEALLAG